MYSMKNNAFVLQTLEEKKKKKEPCRELVFDWLPCHLSFGFQVHIFSPNIPSYDMQCYWGILWGNTSADTPEISILEMVVMHEVKYVAFIC